MREHDDPLLTAGKSSTGREGIPALKRRRDELLACVRKHALRAGLLPPLSLDELASHTSAALAEGGFDESCADFASILLNNETWRDAFAGVPFSRRLLLLPQCLRNHARCAAKIDDFGLLCKSCGRCVICDLKAQAERLGYVVLVAEGTTVVTSLIASGKIEAILGVSCMAMLERVFPHAQAAAVPAIAIPLLYDGCEDTAVDMDSLDEALHLSGENQAMRLNLESLREQVESWFTPESLKSQMGEAGSHAERLGRECLTAAGKRWRPFLAVCTHQALREDPSAPPPETIRKIAIAVECFHKASLIHDDIADGDAIRYGDPTLHEAYGTPIAMNVGDLLLGEGYRLIAESDFTDGAKAEMLHAAAMGHRRLCVGQGSELQWVRSPRPLSAEEVLEIFRGKTSPAFEVALRMGSICAGAGDEVRNALGRYSEQLGIAYQIRDDLEDLAGDAGTDGEVTARPSILLATACEWATGERAQKLECLWRRKNRDKADGQRLRELFDELEVIPAVRRLLVEHKNAAVNALRALQNANLKCLLRRVIGRIFDDAKATDWCGDTETANDTGGGARRE